MVQMANDPSSYGESNSGAGSVFYTAFRCFSLTEMAWVRIAPRPLSLAKKKPLSFREVLHEG